MTQTNKFLKKRIITTTGDTLEEEVNRLKKTLFRTSPSLPDFVIGYCYSDKKTFNEIVKYIREKVDLREEDIFPLSIPPTYAHIAHLLVDAQNEHITSSSSTIIIPTTGFESMDKFKEVENTAFGAHIFNQAIGLLMQVPEDVKYQLRKKVLLIHNINRDDPRAETALLSAYAGDFKSFVWKL